MGRGREGFTTTATDRGREMTRSGIENKGKERDHHISTDP